MELARRGVETTAIDCTAQKALRYYFGLDTSQDLLRFDASGEEPFAVSGVSLRDGHAPGEATEIAAKIENLRNRGGGAVIVDVASGDMALLDALLPIANLRVCMIDPGPVALNALIHLGQGVPLLDLERTALVLNLRDDTRKLSRHIHMLCNSAFAPLMIGSVRRDECVNEAVAKLDPLPKAYPASPALKDIEQLASRIMDRIATGVHEQEAAR